MTLKITCEKTSEPDLSNAVFEIFISFLVIKIHTSKEKEVLCTHVPGFTAVKKR